MTHPTGDTLAGRIRELEEYVSELEESLEWFLGFVEERYEESPAEEFVSRRAAAARSLIKRGGGVGRLT